MCLPHPSILDGIDGPMEKLGGNIDRAIDKVKGKFKSRQKREEPEWKTTEREIEQQNLHSSAGPRTHTPSYNASEPTCALVPETQCNNTRNYSTPQDLLDRPVTPDVGPEDAAEVAINDTVSPPESPRSSTASTLSADRTICQSRRGSVDSESSSNFEDILRRHLHGPLSAPYPLSRSTVRRFLDMFPSPSLGNDALTQAERDALSGQDETSFSEPSLPPRAYSTFLSSDPQCSSAPTKSGSRTHPQPTTPYSIWENWGFGSPPHTHSNLTNAIFGFGRQGEAQHGGTPDPYYIDAVLIFTIPTDAEPHLGIRWERPSTPPPDYGEEEPPPLYWSDEELTEWLMDNPDAEDWFILFRLVEYNTDTGAYTATVRARRHFQLDGQRMFSMSGMWD